MGQLLPMWRSNSSRLADELSMSTNYDSQTSQLDKPEGLIKNYYFINVLMLFAQRKSYYW
jgi:hypothetical protein